MREKVIWTPENVEFLKQHYPAKGKKWCMEMLGMPEHAVRSKASKLRLKARGVSEAWHANNKAHSIRMTGRKRPEQSLVMKRLHMEGKLIFDEGRKQRLSARAKAYIAQNGHPRGMLGKKHSDETKAALAVTSKSYWESMTDEEKMALTKKQLKTKELKTGIAPNRPHGSWKAAWHEIGGKRKYFRSSWEANYAYYLEWLKGKGIIKDWEHEPKTFWFEGVKRGTMTYLPDFLVIENDGSESYHEVKGWMDDRSKTKLKRMAKYYPEVRVILIDAKQYKSIKSKVSKLVPGWSD